MNGAPGPQDFHQWNQMASEAGKLAKDAEKKGDKETARRRREQEKHFKNKAKKAKRSRKWF